MVVSLLQASGWQMTPNPKDLYICIRLDFANFRSSNHSHLNIDLKNDIQTDRTYDALHNQIVCFSPFVIILTNVWCEIFLIIYPAPDFILHFLFYFSKIENIILRIEFK